MPPPPRCSRCMTLETSGSNVEHTVLNGIGDDTMNVTNVIAPLAAKAKGGYSLDRPLYCDADVFAADMEQVIGRKWLVAGHVDRVRNKGDYFLFKVGAESII